MCLCLLNLLGLWGTVHTAAAAEPADAKLAEQERIVREAEAEAEEATREMTALGKQLGDLGKEISSPERQRPTEELRKEYVAITERIAELSVQMRKARCRRDAAARQMRRIMDDDNPLVIHLAVDGCVDEMRLIAIAYEGQRPEVRLRIRSDELPLDDFIQGRIDVLAYTRRFSDRFGDKSRQTFAKAFPRHPPEITFAYRPAAVFVHPSNSLDRISFDQMRLLVDQSGKTWKDLGRNNDGPIHLHGRSWADLLGPADRANLDGRTDPFGEPAKPDDCLSTYRPPESVFDAPASPNDARNGTSPARRRGKWLTETGGLEDNPEGMLVCVPTELVTASGLKLLPLVPRDGGEPIRHDDAAAVASGRYWLRWPLTLMVHPKARPEARRFAKWLQTPEAGKVILDAYRASRYAKTPMIPASYRAESGDSAKRAAAVMDPGAVPTVPVQPAPPVEIDGAVAVLPIASLSRYFLMADASHHAFYEKTLSEAIERDGRLAVIDRTQLQRVLRERKLSLLHAGGEPEQAIVAADVFVVSHVVTQGERTSLRIEAIHAPSAASLGVLDAPINPADPLRFDPPLEQRISHWWSWVLDSLARVRTRPRWYARDVYCGRIDRVVESEAVLRRLRHDLRYDARIAPADGPAMTLTQQELLLHLMGMSKNRGGGYVPMYDYLVDGHLEGDHALTVSLRDGRFHRIAEQTFAEEDPVERIEAARRWLDGQIAAHPGKILDDRMTPEEARRCAHVQSRLEFYHPCLLDVDYEELIESATHHAPSNQESALALPYFLTYQRRAASSNLHWMCLKGAKTLNPNVDTAIVNAFPPVEEIRAAGADVVLASMLPDGRYLDDGLREELSEYWMAKAARAARDYHEADALVKKYEAEGRSLSAAWNDSCRYVKEVAILEQRRRDRLCRAAQLDPTCEELAMLLSRDGSDDDKLFFLSRFPHSKHYADMLYRLTWTPTHAVEAYFEFCHRYVLPDQVSVSYMPGRSRFNHYGHFLYRISNYFDRAGTTPDNERWVADAWSNLFDAHPDKAPHSDFVRLLAASHRRDADAFFAILRGLQRRWPDPNGLPWRYPHTPNGKLFYSVTQEIVAERLRGISHDRNAAYEQHFRDWLDGRIATNDLWWSRPDFQPRGGQLYFRLYHETNDDETAPGFAQCRAVAEAYRRRWP
ncbi:MAG: hypothetical protein GX621_07415, partial [Pirellulaceae bacterium]|nr:hypothetical protein [Pirellulaceae bacterium]